MSGLSEDHVNGDSVSGKEAQRQSAEETVATGLNAETEGEGEGSEDDDALAKDVASIVDRLCRDEFPAVSVTEQTAFPVDTAVDVFNWVQKDDAVKPQSYISEQYRLFRQDALKDPEKAEEIVHAEWAREFHYYHIRGTMRSAP